LSKPNSITLFYDADCGLCEGAVRLLIDAVPEGRIEVIPYQSKDVAESYPEVLEHADDGVVAILPDGRMERNEGTVGVCLRESPRWAWVGKAILSPVLRPVMRFGYRRVARNRYRISRWLSLDVCAYKK
jgi:predicted DCC family thiol-disulfide oxidoreductase YuxK